MSSGLPPSLRRRLLFLQFEEEREAEKATQARYELEARATADHATLENCKHTQEPASAISDEISAHDTAPPSATAATATATATATAKKSVWKKKLVPKNKKKFKKATPLRTLAVRTLAVQAALARGGGLEGGGADKEEQDQHEVEKEGVGGRSEEDKRPKETENARTCIETVQALPRICNLVRSQVRTAAEAAATGKISQLSPRY